jgi:TonB family protein
MNASGRRPSRIVPVAIGALGVLLAGGLVWFWARSMMAAKAVKSRPVEQVVQMIRPLPPPPEAPPPPPPPPDKVEEQLPPDQPDPEPAAADNSQQLGLDADASAGGDGFGLVARKGGADLLGTGSAIFGHYTSMLKDAILEALSDNPKARRGSYAVIVRIWVAADGRIERIALAQGSGRTDLDSDIQQALGRMSRVSESPPLEMPQPVTLKIVSRG